MPNSLKIALSTLVIIIGVFALNDYVVTDAELQEFETQTVQTLQDFRQEMKGDRDIDRLRTMDADYYRVKMLLKQYPGDADLLEEKQRLEGERKALREKLGL